MLEYIVIGVIAFFGFKKGIAILAQGFAQGILLVMGILAAMLLLGVLLGGLRGCAG